MALSEEPKSKPKTTPQHPLSAHLIIRQMYILHSEHRQLIGPSGKSSMLHVSGDGKQLRRVHYVRGGMQHYLVRTLVGHRLVLAQVQRVQSAVWRVLKKKMAIMINSQIVGHGASPQTLNKYLMCVRVDRLICTRYSLYWRTEVLTL